ncbi:hypothetical protein [Lentzea kentuckyensis]|uniref:hypothetical protein n=1 Tax=Lentzea kentuckyensis TaxID=360086 RepID=UPI000A39BDAD|nr:hypothetical protein [Lentzea kentuckyensis]
MNAPRDPKFGPYQQNSASNGGNVFANQGNGPMNVHQDNSTHINAKYRTWTGWAIIVMLAADVAFFFYGAAAYTGGRDVNGDGIRAFGYLFMITITISLIRRWFRQKL